MVSSSSRCQRCGVAIDESTARSTLCAECELSTARTNAVAVVEDDQTATFLRRRADSETVTGVTQLETRTNEWPAPRTEPVVSPWQRRVEQLELVGWVDVQPLDRGGMGDLFVGFDPNLELRVVAKFIRPDVLGPSTRERFRTEAAALARLSHPNVARLFHYAEGDDPYLVMEFVDGGTLADRLKAGVLPPGEAAQLLEGAARGIAAAHATGLIHRDVKPSNLLLDRRTDPPTPRVADFGMAKDVDALNEFTRSGALLGTPAYMSPEQAAKNSKDCDARSDVYSLAATLHAAVTGKPPTKVVADDATPTANTAAPGQSVSAMTLPADLRAILAKGLQKHPNDRYQTATEFADDLRRFVDGQPVLARPRSWPVRAWRKLQNMPKSLGGVASTLAACVIAFAVVGLFWMNRERTADVKIRELLEPVKSGLPVTVLGPKGPPVWWKIIHGGGQVDTAGNAGGATSFECLQTGWVQLVPEVPCDRYELKMEVAELDIAPMNNPNESAHTFGVVVGVNDDPIDGLGRAFHGFGVKYADLDRVSVGGKREMEKARFGHQLGLEVTGARPSDYFIWLGTAEFLPARPVDGIGPWRTIRFLVEPGLLRGYWIDDNGVEVKALELNGQQLNEAIEESGNTLKEKHPNRNIELAPWSPRKPFAIYTVRCRVGIRNVTITPN